MAAFTGSLPSSHCTCVLHKSSQSVLCCRDQSHRELLYRKKRCSLHSWNKCDNSHKVQNVDDFIELTTMRRNWEQARPLELRIVDPSSHHRIQISSTCSGRDVLRQSCFLQKPSAQQRLRYRKATRVPRSELLIWHVSTYTATSAFYAGEKVDAASNSMLPESSGSIPYISKCR